MNLLFVLLCQTVVTVEPLDRTFVLLCIDFCLRFLSQEVFFRGYSYGDVILRPRNNNRM